MNAALPPYHVVEEAVVRRGFDPHHSVEFPMMSHVGHRFCRQSTLAGAVPPAHSL